MLKSLRKALARIVSDRKELRHTRFPEGIPIHKFTDYASYLEAGSKKVWATWKACDIVSQTVMDTPFGLKNRRGEELTNAPADLARILRYPNQFETFAEMEYLMVMHIKLTGNAFVFKSEANINGDRPRELYLLNPRYIKIVPDEDRKIRGYIYSVNGIDVPFDTVEVMHFKRPHPNNEYWGLGDVEAGEAIFNSIINRETWEGAFWKNGASPSGILNYEDQAESQEEFDRVKAKFNKEYGGRENAGKTAMLTGKWSYQQLGLTAVEMQNLEQRRQTISEIFIQHGVPLSVAGVENAANYATAKIDDVRFRRYTIKPLIKILRDTFNTDLVSGWGDIALEWELAGLTPVGDIINDLIPLFDRGGLTINEMRDQAGFETDPDNPLWNQTFINAGLLPLDFAGIADQSTTQEAARSIRNDFLTRSLTPHRNGELNGHPRQ